MVSWKKINEFDYDKNLEVFLPCAFWDIDKGTILKLAEGPYGLTVTHAVKGFKPLSEDEIKKMYPIGSLDYFEWPKL